MRGMLDRFKMLADNEKVGMGEEVVNIGDAPGDGVVYRDDPEHNFAFFDRIEHVFKRIARDCPGTGKNGARRVV